MQINCVSYATDEYKHRQEHLCRTALLHGINPVSYGPENIEALGIKDIELINNKRGAGYWIWKPYIILDQIHKCDAVIYCDADVGIIKNPKELFKRNNYFICRNYDGILNKQWTKRETFEILHCDEEVYHKGRHLEACVMGFTLSSQWMVHIWKHYCLNELCISDRQTKQQYPEFKDHRHDQSILSLLALKYNLEMIPIEEIKTYFDIGK